MRPDAQCRVQLDWFEHHGVDLFDLAVQRPTGTWMQQGRSINRAALQQLLPWCRFENARGANVYIRAHRHRSWSLVFLDDVACADAQSIARAHPALVVETSPNRCHVWIRTSAGLDEGQRLRCQRHLAALPGVNGCLADPGSISGEHWGRLAGFRNRKPGRDGWVNLLRASRGLPPFQVSDLRLTAEASASFSPTPGGRVAVASASCDHKPASSASESEWGIVMAKLERGDPAAEVEAWLIENASGRRGSDAPRYARATVAKACRTIAARMLPRS